MRENCCKLFTLLVLGVCLSGILLSILEGFNFIVVLLVHGLLLRSPPMHFLPLHSPTVAQYLSQQVLEPLLQGFSEPGLAETADITKDEVPSGPSDPLQEGSDARSVEDENGTGNDDDDDDEEFFDTGSIGDDIAALEAELQEEERLLLEEKNSLGEGGVLTSHLLGGREELVRKAAWCLFEVLLPRCVGLEGQGLETRLEEPTSFSHRHVEDILVSYFQCFGMFIFSARVPKPRPRVRLNPSLWI